YVLLPGHDRVYPDLASGLALLDAEIDEGLFLWPHPDGVEVPWLDYLREPDLPILVTDHGPAGWVVRVGQQAVEHRPQQPLVALADHVLDGGGQRLLDPLVLDSH